MFATVKIAMSLVPEELKAKSTIFLITDDTLQAKFGDKFDCFRNAISYQISRELILSTFVQRMQKSKIDEETLEAINSLIGLEEVS